MSKSKNTNPNVYRSKWEMPHGLDNDYKRGYNKRIIEEEMDLLEEEKKEEKEEEDDLEEYLNSRPNVKDLLNKKNKNETTV